MISLLAIIGLIFLLWLLSKGLIKLGSFLENLSEVIADRSVANTQTSEKIEKDLKKIRGKIDVMAEREEEEKYWEKVNKEIKDLTSKE